MMGRRVFQGLLVCIAVTACETGENAGTTQSLPLASISEEIRIGSIDDPDEAFGGVLSLAVASDGSLYTLHRQETAVRRWSSGGRSAGVIGRSGEGPGEFTNPLELGWKGDSLWVFDSTRNSRITFFDREGSYLGVITPQVDIGSAEQAEAGVYPARPAKPLGDGSLLGITPGFSEDIVTGRLTRLAYARMNREGVAQDTILTVPVGRESVLGIFRDGVGTFTEQRFGDGTLVAVGLTGEDLYVLERRAATRPGEATFRLHRIDVAGDTVFSREYPYQPVPISRDTVQEVIDAQATSLHGFIGARTGTELEQWRGWVREAMYVPDYYAPISQLILGRDGSIWLARNPASEEGTEWSILDEEGTQVARTRTPPGFRLLLGERSMIWGVETDSLGVEYIVRYRLDVP